MYRTAIFDLDGTLLDSIQSMKYCGDRTFAEFGYGPFAAEQYQYFVGDGAANLVRRGLAAGGDTEGIHFEEAFAKYKEYFAKDCMYQVKPYKGIPELLSSLKQRGYRLAVLSNKPHMETVKMIEAFFGTETFDVIQGQMDDMPIKPNPAGVFRILEQFQATPLECVYLGDTATDMQTGKSAGAFTVGVLWGFRTREELMENHADALIAHPMELLSMM